MRIGIYEDEAYPVYGTYELRGDAGDRYAVEVDEETLARWESVSEAYAAMQDEMQDLYRAVVRNDPSRA